MERSFGQWYGKSLMQENLDEWHEWVDLLRRQFSVPNGILATAEEYRRHMGIPEPGEEE